MSFAQAWQQASINQDGDSNNPPEPGLYDVAIIDTKAFVSKAGNEVLVIEMRVVAGPAEGYEWADVRGFGSEGQVKAAKSMCARLGVNVDAIGSLNDLAIELKRFEGLYYQVEVVQNGEYRNTYIQQQITPGQPGTANLPQSDVPNDTSDFDPPAGSGDDPGW